MNDVSDGIVFQHAVARAETLKQELGIHLVVGSKAYRPKSAEHFGGAHAVVS